ncbi:hypothetical protein K501DRAFT_235603 [Backusella circina FSU 941]|nr:hypothetical protein K501DRAFT_235603 [Backusella circina FSU 941]
MKLELFFLFCASSAAKALEIKTFCKCFCGSNSTVFELSLREPKPCSNCTKQFCLDNVQDGQCDGIADETCPSNDFSTRFVQR